MDNRKRDDMTTFNVGDRVRVTPEYAAWHRKMSGGWPPTFTPDIPLVVTAVYEDVARVHETDSHVPISAEVPFEYLRKD